MLDQRKTKQLKLVQFAEVESSFEKRFHMGFVNHEATTFDAVEV